MRTIASARKTIFPRFPSRKAEPGEENPAFRVYSMAFYRNKWRNMWNLPDWFLPIIASALALGLYDVSKKHAVRDNAVMPVLFFATLTGSTLFLGGTALAGNWASACACDRATWILLLGKALLVGASWGCVYYAMRELPISIAAPVRASAPLWTFIGSLIFFSEVPSLLQAAGMLVIFAGYYLFSVLGKLEGIHFLHHRGIHFIMLGTLLGAASALYDKYLLNVLGIPRGTVQFWFSVDLVFVLGAAYCFCLARFRGEKRRRFEWRWSIPLTGALLIVADYLYFYAVSLPEIRISILSLVRRSSCVVTFAVGAWYFHDVNVRGKALALLLILLGVLLLAVAG